MWLKATKPLLGGNWWKKNKQKIKEIEKSNDSDFD